MTADRKDITMTIEMRYSMVRKLLFFTSVFLLTFIACLHASYADYGTENFNYGPPPPAPVSPIEGETSTFMYDLRTAQQVTYWGRVVDGIGKKFAPHAESMGSLDTAQKRWDFIKEKKIDINEQEAKIICLYMKEGDPAPAEDVIKNFPAWPECGGVLDTMFGENASAYLVGNQNDEQRLLVFKYLLGSMGITGEDIEATIGGQEGANFAFPEGTTNDARECYTPGNNIRTYSVDECWILCRVTKIIIGMLNASAEVLVKATAGNPKFQAAVIALLTLYITIYGAMVLLGIADVALGDAVVRIAKVAVVAMLISSETIMLIFNMMRCTFIEGTTYLVNAVSAVGLQAVVTMGGPDMSGSMQIPVATEVGGVDICGASYAENTDAMGPLVVLEALVVQVFSPHMILVLLTLVLTKVFGFILAIFLLFGLFGFISAILGAVTIYLTSLIAQYMLLSLLPFFIAFLLFERTKYLFDGWVNQFVSYSFAPIFLFAYISLFVVIIQAALAQILDVQICWAIWLDLPWVFDVYKWHFFSWDTNQAMHDLPFGLFEVGIFMLLVYLMRAFEGSVEQMAMDLGQGYVIMGNAAKDAKAWFGNKTKAIKSAPVKMGAGAAKMAAKVIKR